MRAVARAGACLAATLPVVRAVQHHLSGSRRLAAVTESLLLAAREEVEAEAARVRSALEGSGDRSGVDGRALARMWVRTFTFTARYAWSVFPDDATVFVSTGDISQMWLRDSTAQLMPYIDLAARSPAESPLRRVLEGAMARQVRFILSDPYASAFYDSSGPNKQECPRSPNCHRCSCIHCSPACGNYTFQRDYELDAVLFPLLLHHRYWQATGSTAHLDSHFVLALRTILDLLRTEQWHVSRSNYSYMPDLPVASGRRRRRLKEGMGSPGFTQFKEGVGLVWSFAMPSDDQAHGYNIPQNLMLVVTLRLAAELAAGPLGDSGLAGEMKGLASSVDGAVQRHGVVSGPNGARIYAFEVDGAGHSLTMDDANMPNLLWLPYLGYNDSDGIYEATRKFVLSGRNWNFFSGKGHGKNFSGLGSHHSSLGLRRSKYAKECTGKCVWHLGLIMQGMTAASEQEQLRCMQQVLSTSCGRDMLHEGFNPNDPCDYTRDGFGWANALFSEWVMRDWVTRASDARSQAYTEETAPQESRGKSMERHFRGQFGKKR